MKKFVGILIPVVLFCGSARADSVYSFVGLNPDPCYVDGGGCPDTLRSFTGYFTMPTLADNLNNSRVYPSDWNFIFPHRPFDFSPNPGANTFYVSTDAQGNITQWNIFLDDQWWNQGPDWLSFYGTPALSYFEVYDAEDDPCIECDNFTVTGGWTDPPEPVAVPEPGTLLLTASGLLGLVMLRKG